MATADSEVIVCGTGAVPDAFRSWLPGASDYWQQPEGGLGERLEAMFAAAFDRGAPRAVAIGSDAPLLIASSIEGALDSLTDHDVCLLPAADGGYVLIGCSHLHPCLFRDMPWSKADLMSRTLAACAENTLRVHIGPMHQDVDTEADWNAVRPLLQSPQSPYPNPGEIP
jgi:rSAM/selenodomain-associated transferase 1